jgi:integrase
MHPVDIKPVMIRKFLTMRARVAGNRDKAVLSTILTHCVEWGIIERNLAREVKRKNEKPRDRCVTDSELSLFKQRCNKMLLAYVELKTLTGLRQGQILGMRRNVWDG